MLSHVERAKQALSAIFEESEPVKELYLQLKEGLITPVEYSYKILNEWSAFIHQVATA